MGCDVRGAAVGVDPCEAGLPRQHWVQMAVKNVPRFLLTGSIAFGVWISSRIYFWRVVKERHATCPVACLQVEGWPCFRRRRALCNPGLPLTLFQFFPARHDRQYLCLDLLAARLQLLGSFGVGAVDRAVRQMGGDLGLLVLQRLDLLG